MLLVNYGAKIFLIFLTKKMISLGQRLTMRSMIIYGIILGTSQHFDLYHMLICPLLWSLPFERSEEFFLRSWLG